MAIDAGDAVVGAGGVNEICQHRDKIVDVALVDLPIWEPIGSGHREATPPSNLNLGRNLVPTERHHTTAGFRHHSERCGVRS